MENHYLALPYNVQCALCSYSDFHSENHRLNINRMTMKEYGQYGEIRDLLTDIEIFVISLTNI